MKTLISIILFSLLQSCGSEHETKSNKVDFKDTPNSNFAFIVKNDQAVCSGYLLGDYGYWYVKRESIRSRTITNDSRAVYFSIECDIETDVEFYQNGIIAHIYSGKKIIIRSN